MWSVPAQVYLCDRLVGCLKYAEISESPSVPALVDLRNYVGNRLVRYLSHMQKSPICRVV